MWPAEDAYDLVKFGTIHRLTRDHASPRSEHTAETEADNDTNLTRVLRCHQYSACCRFNQVFIRSCVHIVIRTTFTSPNLRHELRRITHTSLVSYLRSRTGRTQIHSETPTI